MEFFENIFNWEDPLILKKLFLSQEELKRKLVLQLLNQN